MTEGPLIQHDKSMCVRIWLEVGHACEPRSSALGRSLALDWSVWVRGVSGRDISTFVHKVVFHLRPPEAFVYPKRVLQEPPYEIQESGCASIDIPIHVYLKHSSRPKKIRLRYSLQIENNNTSSSESRCIYYDLKNPSEELCAALMSGGGELVARAGVPRRAKRQLVVSDAPADAKRYRFVEPVPCRRRRRRAKPSALDDACAKCGHSVYADLRKQLRSVAMTEDEINRVSQLYLSYSSYEKSVDALRLPPPTDDIYRLPEPPSSLRAALKEVEENYMLL